MSQVLKTKNRPKEGYASFRTQIPKNAKVDNVPVGNDQAISIMFGEEDDEPIEFVNAVMFGEDHPVYPFGPSEEVVLTKKWADSFASSVNDKPGLLYLAGHEDIFQYKTRALASGYIVGAKVKGEMLYLRNRLLPKTSPEGQDKLKQTMNEIKAGLLSTSTGDFQRYEWKEVMRDGNKKLVAFAMESVKAQSNALVEWDMTGSDASIIATSFKENGLVEPEDISKGDEDMKLNGKDVTVEEFFSAFKEATESGELAVSEVASRLGLELRTEEDKKKLTRLSEAEGVVGDISEYMQGVIEERKSAFGNLRDAALLTAFKDESLVESATELFALSEGTSEDIQGEIERIQGLKVVQAMQKASAGALNWNPGAGDAPDTNKPDTKTGTMEV